MSPLSVLGYGYCTKFDVVQSYDRMLLIFNLGAVSMWCVINLTPCPWGGRDDEIFILLWLERVVRVDVGFVR